MAFVSLAPTKSDQEVTDAFSKLTNEDLNVMIEDIYRIELAKMYKKATGSMGLENASAANDGWFLVCK